MKPKVSAILPTNRINSDIISKIYNLKKAISKVDNKTIFTREFTELIKDRLHDVNHYLEPTLKSLEIQKSRDFELVISHRYPEDAIDIVKGDWSFPIRLVREKDSIWHSLGNYGTLSNNINNAVIHSKGELLWRLDDLTFFNEFVLEEMISAWNNGTYITSRGFRCIDFDNNIDNERKKIGLNKTRIVKNGWIGEWKPISTEPHIRIPNNMCWGFSSTISIKEFLELNGHNEIFDGSICGTDMELGDRLSKITSYNRMTSHNIIYEINDVPYKNMIRDDVTFRSIIGEMPIKANSWKPDEKSMELYKMWHKKNIGELDVNWDKFMDISYIDLKEEYNLKRLGEIVYER